MVLSYAALKIQGEEDRTMIVVSSLATWNNMGPKQKLLNPPKEAEKTEDHEEEEKSQEPKKEEPKKEEKDEEPEDEEDNEEDDPDNPKDKKEEKKEDKKEEKKKEAPKEELKYVTVPYDEADFVNRKCTADVETIKQWEDKLLKHPLESGRIYIIAAGLIYGNGELLLKDHFKVIALLDCMDE